MDKKREKALKQALKIRVFEEYLLELYSNGELSGTVHTCIGQELIPSVMSNYVGENDLFLSNHRGHGHSIAKGADPRAMMLELFGKVGGTSDGKGGSMHMFSN